MNARRERTTADSILSAQTKMDTSRAPARRDTQEWTDATAKVRNDGPIQMTYPVRHGVPTSQS